MKWEPGSIYHRSASMGLYCFLRSKIGILILATPVPVFIGEIQFVSKLENENILALTLGKNKVRMVTHRGIKKEHIDKTVNIIANISK